MLSYLCSIQVKTKFNFETIILCVILIKLFFILYFVSMTMLFSIKPNYLFLPPTNIFIMFFWSLSKGDSTITLMANAYMKAYKVSPQNRHACNAIIIFSQITVYVLSVVFTINVKFWYVGVFMEAIVCSWMISWYM